MRPGPVTEAWGRNSHSTPQTPPDRAARSGCDGVEVAVEVRVVLLYVDPAVVVDVGQSWTERDRPPRVPWVRQESQNSSGVPRTGVDLGERHGHHRDEHDVAEDERRGTATVVGEPLSAPCPPTNPTTAKEPKVTIAPASSRSTPEPGLLLMNASRASRRAPPTPLRCRRGGATEGRTRRATAPRSSSRY